MGISMRLAALALTVIVGSGSARPFPGTLSGRVTDSGKGHIPGATLIARPVRGGPVKQAVSGADGRYELTGLADGEYVIDAALEGFDITRRFVYVQGEAAQDIDFTLDITMVCECVDRHRPGAPVILEGVVTDGRRNPLPHVHLKIAGENVSETGYTDPNGHFRARVPENHIYELTTASPGFVTQKTTIRVREAARGTVTVTIDLVHDKQLGDVAETNRLRYPCGCPGDVFIHQRK